MNVPATSAEPDGLPRRVLHVLNNAAGGAAESTFSLIEGLARQGIVSAAVCPAPAASGDRERVTAAVEGRVLFQPLWWWNRRLRAPWWRRGLLDLREGLRTGRGHRSARTVAAFARAQQVELIHTNTLLTPEGARAAHRLGLPHVWHLRELVGPGRPFRFWREASFVSRRVMGQGEVLVANSGCALDALRAVTRHPAVLDGGRAVVVHNGIEVERFADLAPPALVPPVVVGMVANLTSRWKQHDLFLEAVAAIDPSVPATFVVVGRDPTAHGIADEYAAGLHQRIARPDLAGRVELVGEIPDPRGIMERLDIVVHPCQQESFGRVAVEAMAAGRPIVAVRDGGAAEVVRDGVTGVLVAPGDAAALARTVEALVAEPDRCRHLGAAGRHEAAQRFSVDQMVQGVLDAYRRAMTAVPRPARSPRRAG